MDKYDGIMGGLTNPGFSNTGGPPLPRKKAPLQKSMTECPKQSLLRPTRVSKAGEQKTTQPLEL